MADSIIPFSYRVNITLAANATGAANLLLMADSTFEVHYVFGRSSADGATTIAPNNFELSIQDQATGRLFMSQRIPQALLAGNAFNNAPELRGLQFQPQTNLLFDFINLTNASLTVDVVLKGNKILIGG